MIQALFTSEAKANLATLDKAIAQRLLKKLRWLCENFEQASPEPLSHQWAGYYKLRVGDYRLIYHIETDNLHIVVHFIGHRREIHK